MTREQLLAAMTADPDRYDVERETLGATTYGRDGD